VAPQPRALEHLRRAYNRSTAPRSTGRIRTSHRVHRRHHRRRGSRALRISRRRGPALLASARCGIAARALLRARADQNGMSSSGPPPPPRCHRHRRRRTGRSQRPMEGRTIAAFARRRRPLFRRRGTDVVRDDLRDVALVAVLVVVAAGLDPALDDTCRPSRYFEQTSCALAHTTMRCHSVRSWRWPFCLQLSSSRGGARRDVPVHSA